MVDYLKPLPVLDIEGRFFWESCKKHEMALPQCVSCKQFRYPPRSLCPKCHSPEAQWTPISGRGQVYVALVMCRSYGRAWEHDVPYNISLIDLEEGVRMWSNVIGCLAEEVKIGDRVKISYDDVTDDITLPKFRKA
jgi:uncharacterized OB-fold protein